MKIAKLPSVITSIMTLVLTFFVAFTALAETLNNQKYLDLTDPRTGKALRWTLPEPLIFGLGSHGQVYISVQTGETRGFCGFSLEEADVSGLEQSEGLRNALHRRYQAPIGDTTIEILDQKTVGSDLESLDAIIRGKNSQKATFHCVLALKLPAKMVIYTSMGDLNMREHQIKAREQLVSELNSTNP